MAEIWPVTNAQYHADNSKLGSTMLRTALRSLGEYRRRYVDAPPMPWEQTASQLLGSVVHTLVLEPEHFDDLYAVRPDGIDGRTTDGKKRLAEWRLASLGKTELTPEVRDQARAMAASVLAEIVVREAMDGAIRERAIVWEEDDLIFKCKPDLFLPRTTGSDLILDLKTASDPSPECWGSPGSFSPIRRYRYDLQGAHYWQGMMQFTGRDCAFGLIVVGSEDPYEVYTYDLSEWLGVGLRARQQAIELIKSGPTNGWRRPLQNQIVTLSPMRWDLQEE